MKNKLKNLPHRIGEEDEEELKITKEILNLKLY